tara:strand:- start:454 stop:618 length:165 start_codon:yes stop_codon:yes gene_type:complete
MPSVATQTDISTITESGFRIWCRQNMDLADGLTELPVKTPKAHIWDIKKKLFRK